MGYQNVFRRLLEVRILARHNNCQSFGTKSKAKGDTVVFICEITLSTPPTNMQDFVGIRDVLT